jgi:hypothetical protein
MAGSTPFPLPIVSVSASSMQTISTASHYAAYALRIQTAGNLDAVAVGTISAATPVPLTVRLEGINASGNPDGSLIHANATGTMGGNVSANAVTVIALNGSVAVTRGQKIAIVVLPSTTPVSVQIAGMGVGVPGGGFPYSLTSTNAGSSWGKVTSSEAALAVRYDDGTYAFSGQPLPLVSAFTQRAISTGTGATTGTRRGIRFRLDADLTLEGVWAYMIFGGTTADGTFELYDDGGSLLATLATIDGAQSGGTGVQSYIIVADATYSLTASTWYRLVFTPSSANSVTVYEAATAAAGVLRTMTGYGVEVQQTAYVSSAWVDTATSTTLMGVIGTVQSAPGGGGGTYDVVQRVVGSGLIG